MSTKFFTNNNGNTLSEQIIADVQRDKLLLQIATLENKMKKEKQFSEQRRLFAEIKRLKVEIN